LDFFVPPTHPGVEERHERHDDDQEDKDNVVIPPFLPEPEPPVLGFLPGDQALLILDPLVLCELLVGFVHHAAVVVVHGNLV
jgi:hypothetical protein